MENNKYSIVKDIKLSSIEGMFSSDILELLENNGITTLEQLFINTEDGYFLDKICSSRRMHRMIYSIICLLKYKYLGYDLNLSISFDSDNLEDSVLLFQEMGCLPRSYNILLRNKFTPKKFFETMNSPLAKHKFSKLKNCGEVFALEIYEKGKIIIDYYNKKNNNRLYDFNLVVNNYSKFSNIKLTELKGLLGREVYEVIISINVVTLDQLLTLTDDPDYINKVFANNSKQKEIYSAVCLLRYKYLGEDLKYSVSFDSEDLEDSATLFSKIGYSSHSLNILLRNRITPKKMLSIMNLKDPKSELLGLRGCGVTFADEIFEKTKIVVDYYKKTLAKVEMKKPSESNELIIMINKLREFGYSYDEILKMVIDKTSDWTRKRENK